MGKTGPEGDLIASNVLTPTVCRVAWHKVPILDPATSGYPIEVPEPEFLYSEELDLSFRDDASGEVKREDQIRLENLGYMQEDFDEAWGSFQDDYELDKKTWFDQKTHDRLVEVHRNGIEVTGEDVPTDGEIDDWENDGPPGLTGPRLRLFDPTAARTPP